MSNSNNDNNSHLSAMLLCDIPYKHIFFTVSPFYTRINEALER